MVEPHGLIVEERRVERRRVVHLQVRTRIREQRETCRVRLRKSVQRKRGDRQDDLLHRVRRDALLRHALAQLHLDLLHTLLGAFEAHRTAKFLGLSTREPRSHHRHAQQLLLKERHAKRALQDRLERRVRIDNGLASCAAIQIRMHHLSNDGARANDGNLHDQVVERGRLQPRQRRHLCARLYLEDPNRVRLAQHAVDRRVVLGQMCEIDKRASGSRLWALGARRGGGTIDERERILNNGHHAQSEEIDFYDPHVGAVVLVPLHHDAARHAGVLERDDRIEASLADHHAARVLAQMPRQVLHLLPQLREETHAVPIHVESDRCQVARQRRFGRRVDELEVIHRLREPIDLWRVETERFPHFSRCTPAAIRDDIGGHRGAELSVFLVDVLNHLFAAVAAR